MFISPSLDTFKAQFISQLQIMLTNNESGGLGAFILVLANSMQDKTLFDALYPDLQHRFLQLQKTAWKNSPVDDKHVFEQIECIGIEHFNCWEKSDLTPWELVYNPIRALRPARASEQQVTQIQQAFDVNKFHFNKPFLQPEILWEGIWNHINIRVLYNKFPFAPWHLLLALEPEKQHPQFVTLKAHQHIFQLINHCQHLPHFGIAYNSLGAYASINQLHFQGFIRQALPIEQNIWQHNGGKIDYPITCQRYDDPMQAWEQINALQQNNQPYNLLYRPEVCYVIPQQGQGHVTPSDWVHGAGWHEMCGVFTVTNNNDISRLNPQTIHQELTKFNLT